MAGCGSHGQGEQTRPGVTAPDLQTRRSVHKTQIRTSEPDLRGLSQQRCLDVTIGLIDPESREGPHAPWRHLP